MEGFRCDQCKEFFPKGIGIPIALRLSLPPEPQAIPIGSPVSGLPSGSVITINAGSNLVVGPSSSYSKEIHLCSLECLREWADEQEGLGGPITGSVRLP